MENMPSDEYSSINQFYDKLILESEEIFEATISRMKNAQLIDFYEYVKEKSEDEEQINCEFYWYASLVLESKPLIKMYINGQLYEEANLGSKKDFIKSLPLTEEDIKQINETLTILEQRRKAKRNPLKALINNLKK